MDVSQVYRVRWVDGTERDVPTTGRTLLDYERLTDKPSLPLLMHPDKVSSWYARVWAQLRAEGVFDGSLEEFEAAVEFVWPVTGDPTQPAGTPPEVGASSA
jgi:hypothetical protein